MASRWRSREEGLGATVGTRKLITSGFLTTTQASPFCVCSMQREGKGLK